MPAAAVSAPQPSAEPFELEQARQKAAGTFSQTKDGRRRRSPFENPLRAPEEPTPGEELAREVQAQLVTEAQLSLGLYEAALRRQELASADVHLNRLMEILSQSDKFSVLEFREQLDQVRARLGDARVFANRRFIALRQAFEAGDHQQVVSLYDELVTFVDALPEGERQKLAGSLTEMKAIAQRAQARLAFDRIPLAITGVVVSAPDSYATVNGLVLGVGDLVRKAPVETGPVSPLNLTEPLDPPVKVAEIHLTEVVFEFQGEQLSRKVGRRYLIQERGRGAGPGALRRMRR
jgi:hypothetical protein